MCFERHLLPLAAFDLSDAKHWLKSNLEDEISIHPYYGQVSRHTMLRHATAVVHGGTMDIDPVQSYQLICLSSFGVPHPL